MVPRVVMLEFSLTSSKREDPETSEKRLPVRFSFDIVVFLTEKNNNKQTNIIYSIYMYVYIYIYISQSGGIMLKTKYQSCP